MQISLLPGGRRLHLHHGPIDLIVEAFGAQDQIAEAYALAGQRFDGLLEELVAELPALRSPVSPRQALPKGSVANAMSLAARKHLPSFVTPMAAVAGAVADAVVAAMTQGPQLERAYVNNGGDCAFYLAEGTSMTAAIAGLRSQVVISASSPVRGLATSGWRGRSWSLGIADSVTVLAATAAQADVAATMLANAVDLPGHPAIQRLPANQVEVGSELEERLVTIQVGKLTSAEITEALANGEALARALIDRGEIEGAVLALSGNLRCLQAQEDTFLQTEQPPELAYA
ncbi:MAG: UPF0280 family protein [Pseudomonadota bacterium]